MAATFWLSIPLAFVWMLITTKVSPASFLIGYVLSFLILSLLHPTRLRVDWRRLPGQVVALIIYGVILYRDILFSGVDVARRVLSVNMRLKPGVVAVPTQDQRKSLLVAALSANAMSLTPGELVVEIEENAILYVHTLDVDATLKTSAEKQKIRIGLLNRILGREPA